ncbi:MAG: thermonuclease family protein [Nanoarchaeota archaeon]
MITISRASVNYNMQLYLYKAKIINIVDGDTIDAEIDVGFKLKTVQRLRLLGVNTAETHSKDLDQKLLAKQATEFTSKLLDKNVIIQTEKSDAFGRYLAKVFYIENGIEKDLSNELLVLNLAKVFKTLK